jgi:23S rRNA (uracil1939-C5)-methyltransferase
MATETVAGELSVTIEKLIYGGEGLAHHDGHTVFVPFVLPGEVVRIRPVERKKKFIRGQALEIVQPAATRAAATCPHFTDCGGCHYQHIPYEEQLQFKAEILRETLRRLGRIEWPGAIETHASPAFGYRNRAQWKVRSLAGSGSAARAAIGYFRASSNALCAVDECPILSPRLAEALRTLQQLAAKAELPQGLREMEVFADAEDARFLLTASLSAFEDSPERLAARFRAALCGAESILLHDASRDRFHVDGPGFLIYRVAGVPYRVGHLSFFQVNRALSEELVRLVPAGAPGRLALDLYAGVGLFSHALIARFDKVIAVEANPAAARDLAENLREHAAVAQCVNADAQEFVGNLKESPDFVILDPPRAGVAPATLERLAALAPRRIAYLSCDPSTLARDLKALVAAGYRIGDLHLFDVFPQTFHIESLARLEKQP